MNLYEYFTKIIAFRGDIIYKEKLVFAVFNDHLTYHAVVGKNYYKTSVTIKDGVIVSDTCTCKYQDSCKHAAALALYIKHHENELKTTKSYLNSLEKQEIVELLISKRLDFNMSLEEFHVLSNSISIYKQLEIISEMLKINIHKALYMLNVVINKQGAIYKSEYLEILELTCLYYEQGSLAYYIDILDKTYLIEDLSKILIKNNKEFVLIELIKYLDKLILKNNDNYKKLKLKILFNYNLELAKNYAEANLDYDEYFVEIYIKLENNYEEVLLNYLENYNESFNYEKAYLIDILKKSKKTYILDKLEVYL